MTRIETVRAKPARNPRGGEYRCAECGTKTFPTRFADGYHPAQCQEHPEADTLTWDWDHRAAALSASQRRSQTHVSFEAQLEELHAAADEGAEYVGSRRYNATLVVLPLLMRWGDLPERKPLETTRPIPRLY